MKRKEKSEAYGICSVAVESCHLVKGPWPLGTCLQLPLLSLAAPGKPQ